MVESESRPVGAAFRRKEGGGWYPFYSATQEPKVNAKMETPGPAG
jgi:hypothetical protein